MPRYTSKKKAAAKRRRKTVTKSISRDKRILKNWAVRGTARDYEKVRQYAAKFEAEAPDYVHVGEIDKLKNATRRSMLEDLHGSGGDDNSFTNALAWLWSKVPGASLEVGQPAVHKLHEGLQGRLDYGAGRGLRQADERDLP